MPLKLSGPTSGYAQIQAAAVAANNTLTLPSSNGSIIADDGAGNVSISNTLAVGTASVTSGYQSEIKSAAGVGAPLLLTSADATGNPQAVFKGSRQFQIGTGNASSGFINQFFVYDATAAATRLIVDSSGNLQVGGTTVANTTGYVNSRTNTRAWVRWVGSTGAVTASYNVSSVTRNSTGNYTVNFTTSLADANYAPIGMTAGAATYNSFGVYMQQTSAPTASSCAVTTLSNAGTAQDCIANQLVIFGN